MTDRLTFTLAGRDELSRVLNGTADSADRLRLRMAGITADSDGTLRDLQGRFLNADEAARRLADTSSQTRGSLTSLSDSAEKLGEKLKASLITLAPAAVPASAALAAAAGQVAAQFGAAALGAAAYGIALKPQLAAIQDVTAAQDAYDDAVRTSGTSSASAITAQVAYQQQLAKLPPATQEAAVALGILRDDFQDWSDDLSGDVMGPFTKSLAVADAVLPKTSGLVRGASTDFDRLITMVGGAISTPGFDSLTGKVTTFADKTMDDAVDSLTIFLAKADTGEVGGGIQEFLDYAHANGPAVWSTLEHVGEAALHLLEATSDVGVGMLDLINALSGIVSAVPPEAIADLLQLAIAIKAVRLASAGADTARAALAALGVQVGAMRTAAAGTSGALAGTTAAIGSLSKGARAALVGTGIGVLLVVLDSLSEKSAKPKPDVDKLTTSLATLGETGKTTGEAVRVYGKDLDGLGDALATLAKPSGLDKTQQFLTQLINMDSTPVKNAKEAIGGVDDALANLVSEGKADLAAAALANIETQLRKQGFTADEVEGQLDDYKAALAGQALEQRLAAESMGLFGDQAQEVQTKLADQKESADGLRQSIEALNNVQREGLSGMIGFEAAIDAASKAASENAGVLDMQNGKLSLGTEKQRTAAQALNDLAAKTDDAAASARENGASWSEVNGIYDQGRKALIKSATQMGLTTSEARKLADQILSTPDKTAKLKGNLEDLKDKLADAKKRLAAAPSSKTAKIRGEISDLQAKIAAAKSAISGVHGKTVAINIVTTHTTSGEVFHEGGQYAHGGLIHRASGGPIPGFDDGGHVRGPGTATSDSVLMWGSTGEFMMRAAAVDKYGLAVMEAMNAGTLPVPGRSASPGLAAAAAPSSTSTAAVASAPVTYNVYARSSVIDVGDLQLLTRQEEARQRVGRPR